MASEGGGTAHENMPPYLTVKYIIAAVTGAGAPATVVQQGQNAIINGNFDIWQRATSQIVSGTTGSNWTADRWLWNVQEVTSAATVSRQAFTLGQTDVPHEPTYFLRYDVTAAGGVNPPSIEQRIEDVRTFADEGISISFYAKADAAKTIRVNANQFFGSGGSSTVTAFTNVINLTTSWQRFELTGVMTSISGKTIGTGSALQIVFATGVGAPQVITFDLAQVQVERGIVPTPFEYKPIRQELVDCQRYYEKSYDVDTTPGTATYVGAEHYEPEYTVNDPFPGGPINNYRHPRFVVRKRIIPTIVVYSPVTGTPGAGHESGTALDFGTVVAATSYHMFTIAPAGPLLGAPYLYGGAEMWWQWTADSEL